MKKSKFFLMVVIIFYSIYFLMAIKGITNAGDSIIPNRLSVLEVGHSIVKVFAYGSVETVSTLAIFLPKEAIVQTDTFTCVDISKMKVSLIEISKMSPLPEPELGYMAPGFEKMNYYFQARILGAINKTNDINSPIKKLILPYYRKAKVKSSNNG